MTRHTYTYRGLISILILGGSAIWAGWYIWHHHEEFALITRISLLEIMELYALFALVLVCNGVFFKVTLHAFNIRLALDEWLALSAASSFTNYFFPMRGGVGLRALYLSRMYRLRWTDVVTMLSAMYLMHIVINGLLALGGMGLVWAAGIPMHWSLALFFLLVTGAGLFLTLFDCRCTASPARFPWKQLNQILMGWQQLRARRPVLIKLWGLTLLLTLTTICQCKLAFTAFSLHLSWGGVLVYAATKNLALLLSFTPGAIGIVESISIYLGSFLKYSTSEALLVQGLIRTVSFSTLLLTGPIALMILKKRVTKHHESSRAQAEVVAPALCTAGVIAEGRNVTWQEQG